MEQNNITKDFDGITSNEEIFNSQLELTLAISIAGLFIVPVLYFMSPHWQQPALKYISSIVMILNTVIIAFKNFINLISGLKYGMKFLQLVSTLTFFGISSAFIIHLLNLPAGYLF
jgi:hypothetical protein